MPITKMICQHCGHTYNLPTKTAVEEGFKRCPSCKYQINANRGEEEINYMDTGYPVKSYDSYYRQVRECKNNGTLFVVDDGFGHSVIVCSRFKIRCQPKACLDMRQGIKED